MEHHLPQEQPGLIPGSPPSTNNTYENKAMPPYPQAADAYSRAGTYYTAPPTIIAKERRICGLRMVTFALFLALVFLIIAAAVGGGVGGALAVNNAKTSCLNSAAFSAGAASQIIAAGTTSTTAATSTTASPTSSTMTTASASSSSASVPTTAWGPLATVVPFTGCPDNDNKIYNAVTKSAKFQIVCGKDIPNTGTSDLLNAIVPTFALCMELCASWNDVGKSNGNATVPCKGVAFIPTHVNGDGSGNPIDCVLKSISTGLVVNPGYDVDSGILLYS